MRRRVAIVGAGISGLACARIIAQAGHAVRIFDKGLGLGGRMATRRVGEWAFDHGAQFFTAKGPAFAAQVEAWRGEGAAAEWFERRFVGAPGMNAPAHALARGLAIEQNCEIVQLRRGGDGWSLATGAGPAPDGEGFALAILAMPAPQAAVLAQGAGSDLPGLERVVYAPCWALMAAFASQIAAPDRMKPSAGAIGWAARDGAKPGRSGRETFVIHATPEWSRAHLDDAPEEVATKLLAEFSALARVATAPAFAAAHRWRYALVERPLDAPFLFDRGRRLGACGDWCLGPRVEAAFNSGEAIARHALSELDR